MSERDCSEGCADDGHQHAWEFEPSTQSDFDVYATDNELDLIMQLELLIEQIMDDIEPGEEMIIKIRHNKIVEPTEAGGSHG